MLMNVKHKGKLLFAAGLVLGFGLAALWFEREVIFEKFALGQETISVPEDFDADGLSGSDKVDSQSELDSVPCDSESVDCGDSETDYDD